MKFETMFSPIKIGNMVVKNRFVVPPMGNNFAHQDGKLSKRSLDYYRERARGGFGLITIEATVVHQGAKGGPRKPCLFDDSVIDSFRKVIEACHKEGAKVSVQLQHAGPEGSAKNAGAPIKAASAISSEFGKEIPEALTTEEVYKLVEGYGDAAVRAMKAGIDAVEIHMAHGYLVSSFISPRTNKRIDEFGGSFENRMRFPKLIIENIRSKVGDKVALLARINSSDDVLGGINVQDSAAIAAYLEECGLDGLHISRAVHIRDEYMWAPTAIHGGFNADLVTEIKKAVTIPIIAVGRFTEPQYAELLVKQGRADLIAFGRQSLADPHLPKKAKEGRLDDMIPCIACLQGCVANMYKGEPITCLTNPFLGYEGLSFKKSEEAKDVMIIGGGVGGLSAAFVAAQRGHKVSLYEKSDSLGGNMRIAAYPPGKGDIINMIRSYIVKCEKAGVKIVKNKEVTPEFIKNANPDLVIIATGSKPLVLPIPGIDNDKIVHGTDVLDGKAYPGKKVLIVGGGMVGCETAAFLGEQNRDVTVIEYRDTIATDVISEHRVYLMEDFKNYDIKEVTGAKVCGFYEDGVSYEDSEGNTHTLRGFDTVVLAMGFKNYNSFEESLEELEMPVYVVGDAIQARRALDATREAFQVALEI